eukprot:8004315-Heterocapsa_arctica.AAC.1
MTGPKTVKSLHQVQFILALKGLAVITDGATRSSSCISATPLFLQEQGLSSDLWILSLMRGVFAPLKLLHESAAKPVWPPYCHERWNCPLL